MSKLLYSGKYYVTFNIIAINGWLLCVLSIKRCFTTSCIKSVFNLSSGENW